MAPKEKVAFVLHPSDLEMFMDVARQVRPDKSYAPELIMKFFEWIDPFKGGDFKNLSFDGKNRVDGAMFMVPFLPEMQDYAQSAIVKKIEKTLALARSEGCTVAAMAGFNSILIQGQEQALTEKHDIRITSGNTTTAAVIVNSVEEICKKFKVNLGRSTLSIIGASGDIGFGCFLYFAEKVRKVWLTARGLKGLEDRFLPISGFFDGDIELTTDNDKAIQSSNIVIFVTSAYAAISDLQDFAPGTIVCDASAPENVRMGNKLRPDVFVYHGGIAALPFSVNFGFRVGLASDKHLHGCQVEGILNALDPEIPCSVGRGNITDHKIENILKIMKKPFPFAPAYSIGTRNYSTRQINAYAERWRKVRRYP